MKGFEDGNEVRSRRRAGALPGMLLLLVGVATGAARAGGWEVGVQVGSGHLADDAGFVDDRRDEAIRLLGAYVIDRRWSIQASLGQFGDFTGTDPMSGRDAEAEINGGTLTLRFEMPIGEGRVAPWIEGGVALTDVALKLGGQEIRRLNDETLLLGLGLDVEFAGRWIVRGSWSRFDVEDTAVSSIGAALVRRF